MQNPILIVLHQENSTPGRVGNALRDLGYPLDVRRPRFDDPLPETMAEHAAAIIFGGPMSANDQDEFIRRETEWIGVPLKESKPFLGICLGAQMFANHLGGTVFRHPEGHAEIGYYPIRPTAAGFSLVEQWPECVYQWHREGFDVPHGAELLAEGDTFEVQAIRHGSGYALQFHPDVTHAARYAFCRSRGVRLFGARLAQHLSRALARRGLNVFLSADANRRARAEISGRWRAGRQNRLRSWYRSATHSIAAEPGNSAFLRPRACPVASRSLSNNSPSMRARPVRRE
jgi:GMP synthase (glutamine-hydrolysing)